MREITEKQRTVYNYIAKTIDCHGYAPSIREIARDLKLKSTSTVAGHIDALERKGFISKRPGISRSLCIVKTIDQ